MMKSKIELIKENKTVKQTDDGVVEFFDYSKAMEEYAEQEKIAFAIDLLEYIEQFATNFSVEGKLIRGKLQELKSIQDEKQNN